MTVGTTMESYAARLASFNAAYPPTKKRASNASSGKTLKWPHKNPSPPQLSRAGFFYQPTSSCPDNTTCYLCKSNLDGWEENDNAVEEHLKHSPNCGWAITVALELEIENGSQSQEDPMSERMLDARRMTFGSRWPHENKRGWTCKTKKMIEAGWYYCPTLESEDFVKCSYCSLSLDGWEPKDNPHDEHQRRSPDCVFFALSTTAKSKVGRSKKGRVSKASRMSTQSNFTAISDGISVAETDVNRDDSIISVVEPAKAPKSAKGAKKGSKAKKPAAKSKTQASKVLNENTQVASSYLEPEDDNFEVKVETATPQSKGNKKRKSDEMSSKNDVSNHAEAHNQEEDSQDQPRKRRATRTRGSVAQTRNASSPPQEEHDLDAQMTDAEVMPPPVPSHGQRKGKGGQKRGSSNVRKASIASTASKASLRATIPPDEDIDAVLEAELDRPLTDEEGDIEPPAMTEPKGRRLTRTKPGSRKATASVAPTRRTTRASTVTVDDSTMQDIYPSLPNPAEEAHVPTAEKNEHDASVHDSPEPSLRPKKSKKTSIRLASEQQKARGREVEKPEKTMAAAEDKKDEEMPRTEPQQPRSRLASRQLPARNTRASNISSSFEATDLTSDIPSSRLDIQNAQDDSGHETDASVGKQARTKRGGKKVPAKKVKGGKKDVLMSRNIEDMMQPIVDDALPEEQGARNSPVNDRAGSVEPVSVEAEEPKKLGKPSRAIAKPSKTKKTLPEPETFAREGSAVPLMDQPGILAEAEMVRPSPQPLSALSTPRPASSPQSSDAENQPPSSRPSELCPLLSMQSPSKSQISRVPLAAATPVNSPSRNNISKLQTTFPWTAIEMEHIFEGRPTADREHDPFAFGAAGKRVKSLLASPEKKLTVEQWIQSNAERGEENLRSECERLVGKFEDQGVRALRVLEGIVCAERL